MNKSLWLLGASGLLATTLAALLTRRSPVDLTLTPPGDGDADRLTAAPPEQLVALQRDVASLQRLAGAQAARTSTLAATVAAGTTRIDGAPVKLPAAERRRLVRVALEDRYRAETPDPGWSAPRVKEIRGALAASVPGVNVVSADCASSLCKVLIEHADPESQDALMERVSEVPGLASETFFFFDKDATPPRTTMWMGRTGTPLPHP